MGHSAKKNEIAVGLAIIAASYYLISSREKTQEKRVLVFEDGGKDFPCGLVPNAVAVSYLPSTVSASSLRTAAGKSIAVSKPRLWVQATKEEVTDDNLKKVLGDTHGLSAVVLICTKNGENLSDAAASSEPLQRFPSGPKPLPVYGNALLLTGNHEIPSFNAYENLFKGRDDKTLRIQLPFMNEKGCQEKQYNLDYDPMKLEGALMTRDPHMVEEMLLRQSDFPKMFTNKIQRKIQDFVNEGLFTDSTPSKTWETGHGVLPKYFNAIRIKNYFPVILEKTQVFVREWCKLGNGVHIGDVNDWLTCMTADAVTKASMDYDMRNVERKGAGESLHPFIEAFRFGLGYVAGTVTAESEYGKFRAMNPFFDANTKMEARYEEAKKASRETVAEITERTRKGEIGGPLSFVTGMLDSKASTNGEFVHLSDFYGHLMNIMIAGHETTAATLGFCLAELALHPECLAKAVAEIESVMGDRISPTYEDVTSLPYVDACFKEALRLYAPVQIVNRDVGQDTIVLGKYLVRKGQRVQINNCALHRDPDQWDQGIFGDPSTFNPDRHLPGAPPRHPNAMIPFGFGVRACLGMQFAILEARTFLCIMLNFFEFQLPKGFQVIPSNVEGGGAPSPKRLNWTLRYRTGGPLDRIDIFKEGAVQKESPAKSTNKTAPKAATTARKKQKGTSLLILYGSNSGTCEDFAQELACVAEEEGYVTEVLTLDDALKENKLPCTNGAVAVITSTYNGQPPDNASTFPKWLESADSQKGMQYAVFGVGNSNWENTYQNFPTKIQKGFMAKGATQLMALNTADVSTAGFAENFDDWTTDLIAVLGVTFGTAPGENLAASKSFSKRSTTYLRKVDAFEGKSYSSGNDLARHFFTFLKEHAEETKDEGLIEFINKNKPFLPCQVTKSIQLQSEDSDRSTCHMELELPSADITYRAGDHLEVIANNGEELVKMALDALGLKGEEVVEANPALAALKKGIPIDLPKIPITCKLALQGMPDLSAPPTRKVLQYLADICECPPEAAELRALADENTYADKVLDSGLTLTEILMKYQSLSLGIEEFCALHPRLKPRYYSISSSPLVKPNRVAITVGLVKYSTKTGRQHQGAASSRIHSLAVGTQMLARVTCLNSKFKLPKETTKPVIMVGAGTGVAPFIGFLEEREVLRKQGKTLGPAHLFFGCRCSKTDYIYKDLLESYTESGVLSADGLHVAFSREERHAKVYVQDLIQKTQEELWGLMEDGAVVYVCGDAKRMAPSVKKAFVEIAAKQGHMTDSAANNWMGSLISNSRYIEDVYA